MRFLAKLDPRSAIHQRWRGENRVSGMLDGIILVWDIHKFVYVTDTELGEAQVARVRARPDHAIQLEAFRVLPEIRESTLLQNHGVGQQQDQQNQQNQQQGQDELQKDAGKSRPKRRLRLPE